MKNGYDQFFKQARKVAAPGTPVQPRLSATASSKETAEQLRNRVKPQFKAKRKAKPLPFKLIVTSFLGASLTGLGLLYLDPILKFARNVEISLVGSASAEESKHEAPPTKANKEGEAAAKTEETAKAETGKKEYTAEDIGHFSKLNERKRELDAREEELNRMETELATQKKELEKRMHELESTRASISKVLDDRVQADEQKVDTLVQVYSTMKPQQAAKVFESMDEALVVDILGKMKKKNAAEIMNLIKPEKAQVFSEKLAGYRRATNNSN